MPNASIQIGRMDDNRSIELDSSTTVKQAFEFAGYSQAKTEQIQDLNGNVFNGSETIQNGSSYYLIARVKSGIN